MHLNEDAKEALQQFRVQCRDWEGEASGLMKGHIGKLPGLAVRVALVLAFLDWSIDANTEDVTEITASVLGRACHYVGEHLRGHAHRAYGTAAVCPEISAARKIAGIIKSEKLTRISNREIQRRGLSGLQTAKQITLAMSILCDADWIAPVQSTGSGRPKKEFAVNPKVEAAK